MIGVQQITGPIGDGKGSAVGSLGSRRAERGKRPDEIVLSLTGGAVDIIIVSSTDAGTCMEVPTAPMQAGIGAEKARGQALLDTVGLTMSCDTQQSSGTNPERRP